MQKLQYNLELCSLYRYLKVITYTSNLRSYKLSLNPTHLLKPTHKYPLLPGTAAVEELADITYMCVFTEVLFMFKSAYPLNLLLTVF